MIIKSLDFKQKACVGVLSFEKKNIDENGKKKIKKMKKKKTRKRKKKKKKKN